MGIGMIIGGALLGGLGAAIKNRQANNNAQAIVAARNNVLAETMAKNRPLAQSSRDAFDARTAEMQPAVGIPAEAAAGQFRNNLLTRAAEGPMGAAPVAGSAPEVVKSEIAKAMLRAVETGQSEAQASGRISAPGDYFFDQGARNTELARGLGINSNFAGGNLALLPHLQDLAEVQATRPTGPLGDILMGVGNALGSYGGTRARPAATLTPGSVPLPRPNPVR